MHRGGCRHLTIGKMPQTVTDSSELKRGGSLLPAHEVYLLRVRCIAQRSPRHGRAVVPVPRVRPVERNKGENGVCGGMASGFVPFVPLSCYINFTSSRRGQRERIQFISLSGPVGPLFWQGKHEKIDRIEDGTKGGLTCIIPRC